MKKEIDAEEMIKRLGLEKKPKLNLYGVVSMYKIVIAIIIFICLRLLFAIAIGEKCIGC